MITTIVVLSIIIAILSATIFLGLYVGLSIIDGFREQIQHLSSSYKELKVGG